MAATNQGSANTPIAGNPIPASIQAQIGAQFGVMQVSDTLSTLLAQQLNILDFGLTQAYEEIALDLSLFNQIVMEEMSTMCEITSDKLRVYGGADAGVMQESDEFSSPLAQQVSEGLAVGFPLRRGVYKIGWTMDFFRNNNTDQLARQYDAAKLADVRRIQKRVRRALYNATSQPDYNSDGTRNTSAYFERLVAPQVYLPTYPLLNSDGGPVQVGPNGETFDGTTHTHYMGSSDWTTATATQMDGDLLALCSNLVEHEISGELQLQINENEEANVRSTANFEKMYDEGIIVGQNITYAGGQLNPYNYNNRRIGVYRGFAVWVKPYPLAGYITAICIGAMGERTLVWRTRVNGQDSDFGLRWEDPDYPLKADTMTRDGDAGVWQRHQAAVMYVGSGGNYEIPSSY